MLSFSHCSFQPNNSSSNSNFENNNGMQHYPHHHHNNSNSNNAPPGGYGAPTPPQRRNSLHQVRTNYLEFSKCCFFCLPHGRPRCTSFPSSSPPPPGDFLLLGVGNLFECFYIMFSIFKHLIIFQN